jgi:hypothetical protein
MPLPRDSNGQYVQAPDWSSPSTLAVGSASAASSAVSAAAKYVRLASTVDCYVLLGAAPTATTSSTYLPAGVVEYVSVTGGSTKIAVIRASTDGTLSITECN